MRIAQLLFLITSAILITSCGHSPLLTVGTIYVADLQKQFGNIELVLAAYNAGEHKPFRVVVSDAVPMSPGRRRPNGL